jgi:DNA repair protein RecN (Recombination protein N)
VFHAKPFKDLCMLQELFVKDFAIIDSLHLSFMQGLNIMTGETGAGKSILVGALGLLIGGRASGDLIRSGTDEAIVEAIFDLKLNNGINQLLSSLDLPSGTDQLVVRRSISRTGKNRILINDHLATIQMLEQIGGRLIDISGQYSQQLLLQSDQHINLLDAFGGFLDFREQYQLLYAAFLKNVHELNSLITKQNEIIKRQELLEFQNKEILQACLNPNEEQELIADKNILLNAKKLYDKTYSVFLNLYENDNACITMLNHAVKELQDAGAIDSCILPFKENLANARLVLEDTAFSLRNYAQSICMEQDKLETIEHRLDEIHRLKIKYGATIEQIVSYQSSIQEELSSIQLNTSRILEIRKELTVYADKIWNLAEHISLKRKKAASLLKKKVERELESIGMTKSCFCADIKTSLKKLFINPEDALQGLNSLGMDTVEFLISPNQGEDTKPLARIASGGEISRIVLVIKKLIASNYNVPTLLFDEVDSGIGGAVAEAVGLKLKEISRTHQVICITHLPQIACFGKYHYSVTKNILNGRTVATVKPLNNKEKLEEITRMLGGKKVSEKTRAHALEMLINSNEH